MRKLPYLALAALLFSPLAQAGDAGGLDANDQAALQELGAMMTNPAARAEAIKGDIEAEKASAKVKAAVGGDKVKEEEMYRVANSVFAKIAQEEGGDMDKIQARLNAYVANPDSLGAAMSDSDKAAVRALSSQK